MYLRTGYRTQWKIQNINFKNYQLWLTFSTQGKIWSFHIAVLQWMAKKIFCTKNYNAHA